MTEWEGWYRGEGGSQTVTRILHTNSDIKFDSLCLYVSGSHDMHVTHSHEVYTTLTTHQTHPLTSSGLSGLHHLTGELSMSRGRGWVIKVGGGSSR